MATGGLSKHWLVHRSSNSMECVTPEVLLDISSPQRNFTNLPKVVEDSNAVGNDDFTLFSDGSSPRIRKMYLAAFSALLMAVASGMTIGYTSQATYDMTTRPSSPIKPTADGITWIGSVLALGGMLGSLLAGPASDRLGRKTILILSIIPFLIGWLSISFAKHIAAVIAGRALNGIAGGVVAVAVPVYCVEISTPEVRGLLGASFQGFVAIGNLLCAILGLYLSWEILALTCASVATFGLLCCYSIPESPRWLLSQNDVDGAMRVMRYLHGRNVDVKKECERIYRDIQMQPKGMLTLKECKHPSIYKPAIICVILLFFVQFSGANAVVFYSAEIFAGGNFLDPRKSTIILCVVQVLGILLSNVMVDKAGRKSLLLISGAFMSLSLAVLGFYYYKSSGDIVFMSHFNWMPLVGLVSYLITFSLGFCPIPGLLVAEMIPLRARSTIGGLIVFVSGLYAFIVTKTFSELQDLVCNYGTFWTYSVISIIGCVFVLLVLPETKGKEMREISDYFSKSTKNDHKLFVSDIS